MLQIGRSLARFQLVSVSPSCAVVTKCKNFNFLEPSGPVRACNGTRKKYIFRLYTTTYQYNDICLYRVIQNDCRGTIVQRQLRTTFGKQPPSDSSIRRWYAQFQETGCVCIPELKVRIRTAIETITADVRNELDYRVDVCRITKGAHIDHL